MYVGMYVSAHGFRHGSFCKERRSERKRGKKRGRVLQWQTQSVMQDYSVSFSTAIDVVFMGETQGFSKRSGPCYPCSTLETKAEGGGGWRGFSSRPPPVVFAIWWLLSPSLCYRGTGWWRPRLPPRCPSHAGGGIITLPLLRKRWPWKTRGPASLSVRGGHVCLRGYFCFCAASVCLCVRWSGHPPPRVLNRIYSARAGTSQTLHSMSAPCRKEIALKNITLPNFDLLHCPAPQRWDGRTRLGNLPSMYTHSLVVLLWTSAAEDPEKQRKQQQTQQQRCYKYCFQVKKVSMVNCLPT